MGLFTVIRVTSTSFIWACLIVNFMWRNLMVLRKAILTVNCLPFPGFPGRVVIGLFSPFLWCFLPWLGCFLPFLGCFLPFFGVFLPVVGFFLPVVGLFSPVAGFFPGFGFFPLLGFFSPVFGFPSFFVDVFPPFFGFFPGFLLTILVMMGLLPLTEATLSPLVVNLMK